MTAGNTANSASAQVVEEDRVSKLPKGYERKVANAEWEREDAAKRKASFNQLFRPPSPTNRHWGIVQAAEEAGKDYDRVKAMTMTVDRAERWVAKRTHKHLDESVDRSTHAYGGWVGCLMGNGLLCQGACSLSFWLSSHCTNQASCPSCLPVHLACPSCLS